MWIVWLSSLLILCITTKATAQEYHRYRLPPGSRCGNSQCFSLTEYQDLLRMDSDLRFAISHSEQLRLQVDTLSAAVVDLQNGFMASQTNADLMRQERDRLLERWESAQVELNSVNNQTDIMEIIAWALAGGFAVTTLVLGLIVGVSAN